MVHVINGMPRKPVPPKIVSIEYSFVAVSLPKGWCAGLHPLLTRALRKREFLVMVAGESGDVSTFLQLLDDGVDIEPYHYSVTLYNTGLESARYNMTQKTMRILCSQKCTTRVCASLLHVIVEKLARHAFVLLSFSPQFPRYVAYNLLERIDLPLEVVSWVLQMFDIDVPDNVVALWALVATTSALLPADVLMQADVNLSVVHLNMEAATNGKAMSEKVGADARGGFLEAIGFQDHCGEVCLWCTPAL